MRATLRAALWLLLVIGLCGCAGTPARQTRACRPFDFSRDTFAFANELRWEYGYDANGRWQGHAREPEPSYTLHCLVVARSARQFFDYARFDPAQPVANEATYKRLVRRVVGTNPRRRVSEDEKIVIPGYAGLRDFSRAHERLLKQECGGAWQSYFQRGNWRMVFPFSRRGQAKMAAQLLDELRRNHPPVAHVSRFPHVTINHSVVLFGARETENEILFDVYDPNEPELPGGLIFDRGQRTFCFPANRYFPGGRVDVYEILHAWNY